MRRVTPKLQRVARRLLALEAAADSPGDIQGPPAVRVCDKLRRPLSRLAGIAGFRSLLVRALALASDEVPWLEAVHVTADGSLKGISEMAGQVTQDEMTRGGGVLIAQLIGLLLTFIGEALTLRLVQEAWPELSSDDVEF